MDFSQTRKEGLFLFAHKVSRLHDLGEQVSLLFLEWIQRLELVASSRLSGFHQCLMGWCQGTNSSEGGGDYLPYWIVKTTLEPATDSSLHCELEGSPWKQWSLMGASLCLHRSRPDSPRLLFGYGPLCSSSTSA